MSNNYTDSTGVLVLDRVTLVIAALFGKFRLDPSLPENGQAYIASLAETNDPTWFDVLEDLKTLALTLGLGLREGVWPTEVLEILAKHFGCEASEYFTDLGRLIEESAEREPDLKNLFSLAQLFDDGHGLKAIRMEGCWHGDKPRLDEFGGYGEYVSQGFSYTCNSGLARRMGEGMSKAMEQGDAEAAAQLIEKELQGVLNGVADTEMRNAIRKKLSCKLFVAK